MPVDDSECFANGRCGVIGAKIAGLVFAEAPSNLKSWERMSRIYAETQEVFVIGEFNVEAGLVFFDEVIFGDEGFFVGVG